MPCIYNWHVGLLSATLTIAPHKASDLSLALITYEHYFGTIIIHANKVSC